MLLSSWKYQVTPLAFKGLQITLKLYSNCLNITSSVFKQYIWVFLTCSYLGQLNRLIFFCKHTVVGEEAHLLHNQGFPKEMFLLTWQFFTKRTVWNLHTFPQQLKFLLRREECFYLISWSYFSDNCKIIKDLKSILVCPLVMNCHGTAFLKLYFKAVHTFLPLSTCNGKTQ